MISVPSYADNASSSVSRAGMSRWLVGSSSTSTLRGNNMIFAIASRLRSPPDRPRTVRNGSSPKKRNLARYWRTTSGERSARTERISSISVSDSSSVESFWSK